MTLLTLTNEARDTGGITNAVPALVVHDATNKDVAGENLLLNGLLATVLELNNVFHRDDGFVNAIFNVERLNTRFKIGFDFLFVSSLSVHNEPLSRTTPRVGHRSRIFISKDVVGLGQIDDLWFVSNIECYFICYLIIEIVHVHLVVHQLLYSQSVMKPTAVSATPIIDVKTATVNSTTIE